MTTENKRVAAYLPQTLYDLLGKFKEENGLSESKAIISILAAHFGIAQEVSQKVAHQFASKQELEFLDGKIESLRELIAKTRMDLLFSGSLSDSDGKLIPIPRPEDFEHKESQKSDTPEMLQSELKSESPPSQKTIFEESKSIEGNKSEGELKSNLLSPRGVKELVGRFPNIKTYQSITNAKNRFKDEPNKFIEWARKYDKDGFGWRFDEVDKLYHCVH